VTAPQTPDWLTRLAEREIPAPPSDAGVFSEALGHFHAAALERIRSECAAAALGLPCSRLISAAVDLIVNPVHEFVARSPAGEKLKRRVAWIAAGGYGRGLMSPGSRINIVALHDGSRPDSAVAAVEQTTAILDWAGLNGQVSHLTPAQTLQRMKEDCVFAADMLETRPIAGHETLHREFGSAVAEDFLQGNWGRFVRDMMQESLQRRDPFTGSPYCTEPNLKESIGCLRDIGMLQKLARCLRSIPTLNRFWTDLGGAEHGIFGSSEQETLNGAFDLILRVRNALHFLSEPGSDVLRRPLQPAVARELEYDGDDAVAKLLADVFACIGPVARLLSVFEERFDHVYSVAWQRLKPPHRRDIGDGYVEVGGKMYNGAVPPFGPDGGTERLMKAFLLSQRSHLPVSQTLLDQVAEALPLVNDTFRRDPTVAGMFLELLNGSFGVAEGVAWMRNCGLLQAYLPEFEPLVRHVDYEKCYDYALAEHVIEALRFVDALGQSREEDEVAQRELLSQVGRLDLLRLAIVLHHAGETAGEAPENPVRRVAERMSLSESESAELEFLARNHALLVHYAERRDFRDPDVLARLAGVVETPERLRELYLLTWADCRALGPAGWFSWREDLLYELYQKLMGTLVPAYQPTATPESFAARLLELAAEAGVTRDAQDLVAAAPDAYKTQVSPEQALGHLDLVERLKSQPAAMSYETRGRQAVVWLCTSDVPARFAQLCGLLTSRGLNIVSARAFSLADAVVLDRFVVHQDNQPITTEAAFWAGLEADLVRSIGGQLDIEAAIRGRARGVVEMPPVSRRQVTAVHFDNESSVSFTILDVVAWDRPGLLYSLTSALGELGLNIALAKISTRLDLAQDVFYVNDSESGKKIESPERIEKIRSALARAAEAMQQRPQNEQDAGSAVSD